MTMRPGHHRNYTTLTDVTSGADDLAALQHLAGRALSLANVVVVTGGASVGERDYAKVMFSEQELELLFEKVAIKPGKPIWIGRSQGRWVIGLPGNPTSALVTARLFLAPLLGLLQGRAINSVLDWIQLPIANPFPASANRTTFARAILSNSGLVPLGNQDSGAQATLSQAKWLVRCEPSNDQAVIYQLALALGL